MLSIFKLKRFFVCGYFGLKLTFLPKDEGCVHAELGQKTFLM